MALVDSCLMLLADVIDVFLPKTMEKLAFMLGSSKQGKARRASDDSKSETANHLIWIRAIVKRSNSQHSSPILWLFYLVLCDTVFNVGRPVESSLLIVQDRNKFHRNFIFFSRFKLGGCLDGNHLTVWLLIDKIDHCYRVICLDIPNLRLYNKHVNGSSAEYWNEENGSLPQWTRGRSSIRWRSWWCCSWS